MIMHEIFYVIILNIQLSCTDDDGALFKFDSCLISLNHLKTVLIHKEANEFASFCIDNS